MAVYDDIYFLDIKKNIRLTKDTSTGHIYVKKYISSEQYRIYDLLYKRRFSGVPVIIDIYPEADYFVLIEEYINGSSLQQLLDQGKQFTPQFVSRLVRFLCGTLAPIHKKHLIHRDITASNIIYTPDDQFYLIDFGNARTHKRRQSVDTEFIGTQNYAAPEQFGFGQSDLRTDIYAIGVLMNVLLTGGSFIHEKKYKGKLAPVIKKCTAVKAKERYKNTSQLKRSLFLAMHKPFTSAPMLILYAFFTAFVLFIIYAVSSPEPENNNFYQIKPIETSSPEERSYRRWSDIENCIRDGRFDEAERRLDEAVAEGLTGGAIYILYSENYEAQQKYDDAAMVLINYVYDVSGADNLEKGSLIYARLEYLYPDCSEDVRVKIDEIFQYISQ
ncbi:MAG: serine/threonine protein kinase [Candidatus Ornithomonoglobus sp.]